MKKLLGLALLLMQGAAMAQTNANAPATLNYNYAELRFVDVDDNGGDGLRINGSLDLGNNWLLVGGLTSLEFNNNVDVDIIEVGVGYAWKYTPDWDLVGSARFVNADTDAFGGNSDDTGFALSAGTRGFLAPDFEVRGSVNYIDVDNSDTYLEIAGDYYFTQQISAGLSIEFAGDSDLFTIGGRWYFR